MGKEQSKPGLHVPKEQTSHKNLMAFQNTENEKKVNGIKSIEWIDPINLAANNLEVSENSIKSKSEYCNVFGSTILKAQYKFSIKFKSINQFAQIGIADGANRQRESLSGYRISYDSFGEVWIDGVFKKNVGGYKGGDVVSILGDINSGLIIFKVWEKVVYASNYEIQSKGIDMFPFVSLFRNNSISIEESFPEINLMLVNLLISVYEWDFDLVYEVNQIILVKEISYQAK